MAEVATTAKPFHESVVDMIKKASINDLQCLGELIKMTAISKDHEKIIDAWADRTSSTEMMGWKTPRCLRVQEYLWSEKDRVEAEAEEELVETTFEELNVGDEFLDGEVRFRKTGLVQAVEYLPRTGAEYDAGEIDMGRRPWFVKKVVRKGN
jgi:hypothetical protein